MDPAATPQRKTFKVIGLTVLYLGLEGVLAVTPRSDVVEQIARQLLIARRCSEALANNESQGTVRIDTSIQVVVTK
ncbi:MAG: hypothetical protein LBJ38_02505 [Oscillospiraceae bacterium]|nr:hypothetical protein [Oscillospiraceae bacterium]